MKKGTITTENVIFLLLNLAFFVIMLIFIFNNSNGRPVYEQAYAKEIALMLDRAKSGTRIEMDVSELTERYDKKVPEIFELDKNENRIKVSLGVGGGRSFQYFSDYDLEFEYEDYDNTNNLIIKVK